jgi:F-type H+-transporting ATPase subunit b
MALLTSLGVNSTIAIQLVIFMAVFFSLKYILFAPYFKAFNQRVESTVGQAELAERYLVEAKELEEKFAQKAQAANEKFRTIYDQTRAQAMREYDKMINESRQKAKALIDENRQKIQTQMEAARKSLLVETAEVTKLINVKLIGKDVSA